MDLYIINKLQLRKVKYIMSLINMDFANGGGKSYYATLTNIAADSITTIDCGFEPTQIIVTETDTSNNSFSMFLYDKNYATNKVRYIGWFSASDIYRTWEDYSFYPDSGISGSSINEITPTGFKWHCSTNRTVGRLDIMAIK